ncbi:MAG: methylmalonyl-CoA mutase family protein, partial [SAR324 cluster bacterium]
EIDEAGGALAVIDTGLGRRWMSEGAVRRQRAIDSGARPWVTVNLWPQKPDVPNTAFRIDPGTARRQLESLRRLKAGRDPGRVAAALTGIDQACRTGANMVPPAIAAIQASVTVGEICERWRAHFGAFQPSTDF